MYRRIIALIALLNTGCLPCIVTPPDAVLAPQHPVEAR